jgi:hypothetical protein
VFWTAQNVVLDPAEHHLESNAPPADGPLFAYYAGDRVKPMTYNHFRAKLYELCITVSVAHYCPHDLRIDKTLQLILTKGM